MKKPNLKLQHLILLFLLFTPSLSVLHANEIYRYQDEDGNWHFGDKRTAPQEAEVINYQSMVDTEVPYLKIVKADDKQQLVAVNAYHGPAQIAVVIDREKQEFERATFAAGQEIVFIEDFKGKISDVELAYVPGPPLVEPVDYVYNLPFPLGKSYTVSQGFNGEITHTRKESFYALDIAMPISSSVTAARSGTVMFVRNTYHIGGDDVYFADKANQVFILHDDGTIAVYAHLMMGSIKVTGGQRVETGDELGLIGDSGYSTGPHLHFVVWVNRGMHIESIPFQFKAEDGSGYTPEFDQLLSH